MANWSLFPESTEIKNCFDLRRTPPKGKVNGVFTSDVVMGTPVHFFNGRTVPHLADEQCQPCEHGRSYRWMAYFAYKDLADDEHCVFEITAKIHASVARCHETRNGLRGIQFRSWRPSGRANGRIDFSFKKTAKCLELLPDPPDVKAIMEHIWQPSLDVVLARNATKTPEAASNGRFSQVTQTP